MEEELEKLGSKELLELYTKNNEFINYLGKEYQEIEKKREDK